jgi:hypothetical protein
VSPGVVLAALLYVNAVLFVAATFAPAVPRLAIPAWLSTGALFPALVALLLANLFLHRRRLAASPRGLLTFFAVLSLLALTRLPHLLYPLAWMNSDRSVTLLMARHIAEGASRPVYFYGQLYHGSLDAYLYSLVYRFVPSLPLSAAIANLVLFSLFVWIGAALIRRISGSSSRFYPLLFLSLPLTAASFLSMDYLRGIPLIAFLQTALMYLVFEIVFESRERPFLLGAVSGLLLWVYQPALTTIAVTFTWVAAALLRRPSPKGWKPWWLLLPGFFLGALPHLLSELNNDWFNTRNLFLSSRPAGFAGVESLDNLRKVFDAVVGEIDTRSTVSMPLVALFLIACLVFLGESWRRRSFRTLYLPSIFLAVLLLTILSGYAADRRFIAHYRLLSFFVLLLLALLLTRLDRIRGRWPRAFVAMGWTLFAAWRGGEERAALRPAHEENRKDVAWLRSRRNGVAIGDYFNTIRFAPFVDESMVITAAPSPEDPNRVLELAKYHPLALDLGRRWEDSPRHLVVRGRESRFVESWSRALGIASLAEELPSGRFTLYSGFSPEPSPYLLSILSSYLRERYLPEIEGFAAILDRKTNREGRPKFENRRVVASLPDSAVPADGEVAEFLQGNWRHVLRNDGGRVSFPAGAGGDVAAFRLPGGVAPGCGTYDEYLSFLDMDFSHRGKVEIAAESCEGALVLSELRDEITFFREDDLAFSRGDALVSGLPAEGLRLDLEDEEIDSIDLHVYSFFDFGSSLWANRFEQALTLNRREFPLKPGRNVVRYRRDEGPRVRLDTRHKTLLPAHDSQGNVQFHDTGVVVERIVARRGSSSEEIGLFLVAEE